MDDHNLYILSKGGRIIFTPAPFGSELGVELLIAHIYTNETSAVDKIKYLSEEMDEDYLHEVEIKSMTLRETLSEYLVDILEQVKPAYLLVDDEEIFPLTRVGFDALQDYLPSDSFAFSDLEDSIHSLYYRLCEILELSDEEIMEVLEDNDVQKALMQIQDLDVFSMDSLKWDHPIPGTRFQMKLTRNGHGYSAHNETFTLTISIHRPEHVKEISGLLGEDETGFIWASLDPDGELTLELDQKLSDQGW